MRLIPESLQAGFRFQNTRARGTQDRRHGSFSSLSALTGAVIVTALFCCPQAAAQNAPYVIRQAPEEVQRLYSEAVRLVEQNRRLENPRPEPYIALGDIWRSVGSHEDALRNYLQAASLASANSASLTDRSRLLTQLERAMSDLMATPEKVYPLPARESYKQAVVAMHQGKLARATAYVDEANRLSPRTLKYRALAAICYRRAGDHEEAERQAGIAASLFRSRRYPLDQIARERLDETLQHVAGPERAWFEDRLRAMPAGQAT